jgi:hypothetical protein
MARKRYRRAFCEIMCELDVSGVSLVSFVLLDHIQASATSYRIFLVECLFRYGDLLGREQPNYDCFYRAHQAQGMEQYTR